MWYVKCFVLHVLWNVHNIQKSESLISIHIHNFWAVIHVVCSPHSYNMQNVVPCYSFHTCMLPVSFYFSCGKNVEFPVVHWACTLRYVKTSLSSEMSLVVLQFLRIWHGNFVTKWREGIAQSWLPHMLSLSKIWMEICNLITCFYSPVCLKNVSVLSDFLSY